MTNAIEKLRDESRLSGSDRLILSINGKIVLDDSSGRISGPIELMSATKSIVAIAIAILLKQQAITSLDTPLFHFFPEWNSDLKKSVSIRHILNHTSGIKARRTTEDIYSSDNFLEFALSSEMLHQPGENFFYNNKATQLLSGIVQVASGKRLDLFLDQYLFKPLEITHWTWELDKSGNPHAFAGLALKGEDLLKIGQLMLDKGLYGGHRIFSEDWPSLSFDASQEHDPGCGLLWWRSSRKTSFCYDQKLLAAYKGAGLDNETCKKLASAPALMSIKEFRKNLESILGTQSDVENFINFTNSNMLISRRLIIDKAEVYSAHGYLGQYLSVIPSKKVIALRQMDHSSVKDQNSAEFTHFRELVMDIAAEL